MLSRRGFLIGGVTTVLAGGAGGLWAVEEGLLPGRIPLGRALGRCDVDAAAPPTRPGVLRGGRFTSAYRRRDVRWMLALPPGRRARDLPVALVLHGRGDDARTAFDVLGLHRFLAQHVAAGGPPFALAAVDGGETYWHPRADGDDPLGMLVHELLPMLRRRGLRTDRIGTLGWSMGGYGALLLARQSRRDALGGTRVVAAAAESPALFPSAAAAASGAFDGPADFAEWGDLLGAPEVSAGTALFVSCGDTDAFTAAVRRYRAAVHPTPAGEIGKGCHDASYWRTQAARQMGFLGAALATA